ncbi:MAG: tetratricopeptide repeat protein [Candidatus Aminicenantales bacterium]|jgi:tetratricopeptide (TPR) repeat protein
MKKIMLAAIVLVLAGSLALGQSYRGQGRLKGKVTDESGKPIEGVKIKLYSLKGVSGFELTTNAAGEWTANYIRGGGWNIDFEKIGYEPRHIATNIPEATNNPPIETKLKAMAGLLITDELKAALKAGNQLFEEKKYPDAVKAYEDILAKNPDAYVLYKNVGNCYFELQQYDQAEAAYQKVLEKEPANPDILLLIGNCYANRGENDKAMEWYNKIEFEKITDPMVLFNIGASYTKQSKFEEALKYYKRSVEIQKDFLDGLYQLGLTYLALGRNSDAIPPFEEYLKSDPDSPRSAQVKNFLEFLKKK